MSDDCAVDFFRVSAALAPLKIHGSIGTVSEREVHFADHFVGTAHLGVSVVVGEAGAGFEENEGLVLHGVVHVVEECETGGFAFNVADVPVRIAVVADEIAFRGDFPVIKGAESAHHIGGSWLVGEHPDRCFFHAHEIDDVFGCEAHPVETGDVDGFIGRVDLRPVGEMMTPECGPVGAVEVFKRAVALFQEIMEFGDAAFAVADRAVFVADVPSAERGVIRIAFGEFAVNAPDPFAEDGGVVTGALTGHPRAAHAVRIGESGFGVAQTHPSGTGGGGGGEKDFFPAFRAAVHDGIKPGEIVFALFDFNLSPGEDSEREGVAVSLVHEFKILIDDFRMFEPLVGVPVASVENARKILYDRHVQFLFVLKWKYTMGKIFFNVPESFSVLSVRCMRKRRCR